MIKLKRLIFKSIRKSIKIYFRILDILLSINEYIKVHFALLNLQHFVKLHLQYFHFLLHISLYPV